MRVGIPKEIKNHEYRVGMTPLSVAELVSHGHEVWVETKAGEEIGFSDQNYTQAGAKIASSAKEVFEKGQLIVKVKELQKDEFKFLNKDHVLFTYLHLAADKAQTQALLKSNAICIAYETITDKKGKLPLLSPMSEVAGRMSIQAGAQALEHSHGGTGILLSGVPGVAPANVVIIGGGVVGANAARMALGFRASVTLLDKDIEVLRELDKEFQGKVNLVYANEGTIESQIQKADLVIGAVLVRGAAAPKIITKAMLKNMKKGAAIVDVAIDQGGIAQTSLPTTHQNPTYIVEHIVHYCVANMPGAVARTATEALNNATLPYILKLANQGYVSALLNDEHFLNGLNVYRGKITMPAVAKALNLPYFPARVLLA